MRLEQYIDWQGRPGLSGFFFACGSFGIIDGSCDYTYQENGCEKTYCYTDEKVRLTAIFAEEDGVMVRRDFFENLTSEPQELNALLSRFCLDGNAYEVYTQYSGWQHESSGGWQRLITQVTAATQGIRTCDSATPMMALHNLYTGKNTVFHLLPNSQWKMTARKFHRSDKEMVVVETGFNSEGLRLQVAPGERIELPTVVFFAAESKIDLDAYKLHRWFNRKYPRKKLPVIFNSWLYCFDQLDIDALLHQADLAAELGFEGFMVDAGWFGKGERWSNSVGDWEERTTSGPKGRLKELSARVREHGMVFGLWFELERAAPQSDAVAEHPDHFINHLLLDFANPEAVERIINILSQKIEEYQIGWLKFDFNQSIPRDPSGNAFYRYMQGQKKFMEVMHQRFPELYITNCGGGGFRMELGQATMFDSFWFTDNQGPYKGIEIVKNTLKRMPSCLIERWNVQAYSEGSFGHPEGIGTLLSCNNATWDFIITVKESFTKAFLAGGPLGFSCDLDVPPAYQQLWKEWIAAFKADRDFYQNAMARILIDSEEIIAIQYADPALRRCILQVFTKTTYARDLVVYPFIKADACYRVEEETLRGCDLLENGILLEKLENNSCRIIELIQE